MIMLGPYATANGLIAAVMAAALVWFLRANKLSAALVSASAATIIVIYFWHWTFPQHHENCWPHHLGSGAYGRSQLTAWYCLARRVVPGAHGNGVFGLVGFVLWLAVLVAVLQRVRQSRALDAHFIALFALATFALGTAVMIALGRAGAGLGQALSTRYATFSLVFWLALLGAMWRWRTDAVGELSFGFARRAVLALAVALLVFAYGAWFRVVESWRTQVAVSDQVTAELLAGRFDRVLMARVYPHVDRSAGGDRVPKASETLDFRPAVAVVTERGERERNALSPNRRSRARLPNREWETVRTGSIGDVSSKRVKVLSTPNTWTSSPVGNCIG